MKTRTPRPVLLSLLLLVSLCVLALPRSAGAIVNGVPHYDPFSGHVRVNVDTLAFHSMCSGELLTNRYVITAKHCVDRVYSSYQVTVTMGKATRKAEFIPTKHPTADVALVRLATPFPMPGAALSFKRPIYSGALRQGGLLWDMVSCYGYGQTTKAATEGMLTTGVFQVTAILDDEGKFRVGGLNTGRTILFGDSGGGCFLTRNGRHELAGIAVQVQTDGSAIRSGTGTITLLKPLLPWIKSVTGVSF
jgi:hypothetical protein